MDKTQKVNLIQDIVSALRNWYSKQTESWPKWRCQILCEWVGVEKPKSRFDVEVKDDENSPGCILYFYDKYLKIGYERHLNLVEILDAPNSNVLFRKIAEDVCEKVEHEERKHILENYYITPTPSLHHPTITATTISEAERKMERNHRDAIDAYTYAIQVLGQRKLEEYNVSEMYPKYMFRQDNLLSDGITSREEIYRQTKNYFERMKEKVLDSCGVPATVVMPRNVGYSNYQRLNDLYKELFSKEDQIKEEMNNMGRSYRMPKQCAIIFDNGENLLLDVESVKREEMYCSISPKFELEGRYKYPATAGESDLPMRVLGEWRAALKPELSYEKVIFNDPATIVIWKDGTKTIVKVQPGETYDAEKGLALCFMKKALGNKGNFNNILKKELAQLEPAPTIGENVVNGLTEGIKNAAKNIQEASEKLRGAMVPKKKTEGANEQNENS